MLISGIYTYPIKSCGGIDLQTATVGPRGIENDRLLMLVTPEGEFLTQRDHPRMALIHPCWRDAALGISAPGMPSHTLEPTDRGPRQRVTIWRDTCEVVDQGQAAAEWFSAFLGGDIHPKNKQDVGKRLAMWALADVYKQKDIASSGPLFVNHKVKGSEVTLTFKHAEGGLVVNSGGAMVTPREEWPSVWPEGGFGTIRGFAVAGADKQWHRAFAKIIGNTVVVKSPDVKQPVAVRYAWADNPDCNLYNRAGLPSSPFRTDDWTVNLTEAAARGRR